MAEQNPATPAQAATPGSSEPAGKPNPSAATTPTGQGTSEGTVTISTKEFAQLQRDSARLASFNRRRDLLNNKNNPGASGDPNGDPNADPEKEELRRAANESANRALKAEVTLRVRDILDDPKYSALPASTKALILKNPSALSSADNVEEALLDIEDFVNEQVSALSASTGGQGTRTSEPSHETPPAGGGGPVQTDKGDLEDISHLSGPARSRAILRNTIKKQRAGA